MAVITSYNTLIQAIKDEAEDDGVEFSSFIPVAIDIAEDKLFRELDLPELLENAAGNLTVNSSSLTKPTGYEFAEHFIVTVSGVKKVLKKKQDSFCQEYWPNETVYDVPKYYSDNTITTFRIVPTPSTNYVYEIKYTRKPTKLSTSNATNYYVDNCQDILFAASMIEMSKFMKAWTQIPVWQETYNTLQEAWNVQQMRYRRDGSDVPGSGDTGPNSLKHTIQSQA